MQDHYSKEIRELVDIDLAKKSSLFFIVNSLSMTPFLRPGDRVLVQAIASEFLQRGDLLVTRRPDGFLTHRLVFMDANGWYTKGDRNNKLDAPVAALDIIGIIIAIDRYGTLITLNTRPQRLLSRWQGWLGSLEINSKSSFTSRFLRGISRASVHLSSLLFRL
jgi:signal peptidase I